MKKKIKKNADPLSGLLKSGLMESPSADFSAKLLQASMDSYRISYSRKYRKEEKLGKAIIGVLLFFNLMLLFKLIPLDIFPLWLTGIVICCILPVLLIKKTRPFIKDFMQT